MQAAAEVMPLPLTPFSPPATKRVGGAAGAGLWEVQQRLVLFIKEDCWGGGYISILECHLHSQLSAGWVCHPAGSTSQRPSTGRVVGVSWEPSSLELTLIQSHTQADLR